MKEDFIKELLTTDHIENAFNMTRGNIKNHFEESKKNKTDAVKVKYYREILDLEICCDCIIDLMGTLQLTESMNEWDPFPFNDNGERYSRYKKERFDTPLGIAKEVSDDFVLDLLKGVTEDKKIPVEKHPDNYTKVDDWKQLNVYLKKSDPRYIRFKYPPNAYDNNKLKTNELIAGDTKFTGSKGKNKPYIIMEGFIEEDRIERYDMKDTDYSKSISNLNKFFINSFKNNIKPIRSDPDLSSGYITEINFRYEK